MGKKSTSDRNGFVYSTDPGFKFEQEAQDVETLEPSAQKLRVWLDSRSRGGKTVTLVTGFAGKEEDLNTLGKTLKNLCGTGGNTKDGEIIIQGDHREKILQWLLKNKYSNSKKAGA